MSMIPSQQRLAGVLVRDVITLMENIGAARRYTDNGFDFRVNEIDGPISTFRAVTGGRWPSSGWCVRFIFRVPPQHGGVGTAWVGGCYQTATDWKIEGDELEFVSDMAKAKIFGLLDIPIDD